MSAALALGWYIWTRHRRGLIRCIGYWLALMIICRSCPDGAFTLEDGKVIPYARMVFVLFCPGVAFAAVYLLGLFSFSQEVRLEVCESGFPARLWALPLGTPALAGWPMLGGSATMILGWLTLAWAVRRPYGFDVPLWWPGLLLAVVLAWLQVIVWSPFPLPWMRAVLLIPLSSILIVTPIAILEFGASPVAVCGLLVVLLSAAYWTAIHSVARARRGEGERWVWPAWLRGRRTATPIRRPFASAARAQLWLEWRRNGLGLPRDGGRLLTVLVSHLAPGWRRSLAGRSKCSGFFHASTGFGVRSGDGSTARTKRVSRPVVLFGDAAALGRELGSRQV